MKNSRAARVIFPTGEVKQYKQNPQPVKAAELMFECPGFFIVSSNSLHIGRRFSALGADEEIESGGVYIMFPMRRLNSIITAADMAVFFIAANSAAKRIKGGRIFAAAAAEDKEEVAAVGGGDDDGPRLSLDEVESSGFHHRLSYYRSRKPVLETISEEPIYVK